MSNVLKTSTEGRQSPLPEVSIIVPVYNTAEYLADCLDSILIQDIDSMEIIVINDCSTDHSASILDDYEQRDRRIRVIHLEQNVGLGPVRNKGIEIANGGWVGFVDSDDIMQPNSLSRLLNVAIVHDSEVVIGQVERQVDKADGAFEIREYSTFSYLNFNIANTSLNKCPALINIVPCWACIYRRDFLKNKGIVFRRRSQEDHDFVLHVMLEANKVSLCGDTPYMRYRSRFESARTANRSITQSGWSPQRFNMMVDHLQTVDELFSESSYAEHIKELAQYKQTRLSYYLGVFSNNVLKAVLSSEDISGYQQDLEKMACLFESSALLDTGLDLNAETLSNRPALAQAGFYELALNLIVARSWSNLSTLLKHESLEFDRVAKLTSADISAQLLETLQTFVMKSNRPLLQPKKWIPRLVPPTIDEVILHIGMTKTGSTAIQNFLEKNRDNLINKHILYPRTGIYYEKRNNSNRTAGHNDVLHASLGLDIDFISRFYTEIETTPGVRKVIISAENFFQQATEEHIGNMLKLLGGVKTRIVVYLRRQDSWLESIYSESISGTHAKETRGFTEFVDAYEEDGWLNYMEILTKWADRFGADSIIVRPYEMGILENGVVSDFCDIANIGRMDSYESLDVKDSNISPLSKEDLLVLRTLNCLPFHSKNDGYRPFVYAYIDKFGSLYNPRGIKWFAAGARQSMLDKVRDNNNKLSEVYFSGETVFSAIETMHIKGRLEDVAGEGEDVQLPVKKLDFAFKLYALYNKPIAVSAPSQSHVKGASKDLPVWIRRLRKFARDPRQFWLDSRLRKALIK